MTPQQIAIVQRTFKYINPMAETVAHLFYLRLFEVVPSLKPLFSNNIEMQASKFIQMLHFVIDGLDMSEAIMPEIRALGKRHLEYGVKDEHYDTVGDILLWALGRGLEEDFTPEVEEAWFAAYHFLANQMKSASMKNNKKTVPVSSH